MCATSNHDCVWEELTHSKKSLPNPISPKAPSVWTLCTHKPWIFKPSSLQVSALVYLHLYFHSDITVHVLLHLPELSLLLDLQALFPLSAISASSLVPLRSDLCHLSAPQAHQPFLSNNAMSAKPNILKPLFLQALF